MFCKLVVCDVTPDHRDAFSSAQESWSSLSSLDGFVTQFGGWDHAGAAVIVGVWRHAQAYRRFMSDTHDDIYARSGQAAAVASVRTALFDVLRASDGAIERLATARVFRASVTTIAFNRQASFLQGAFDRVGVGLVTRAHDRPDRFLVVSAGDGPVETPGGEGDVIEHETWAVDRVDAWTVGTR